MGELDDQIARAHAEREEAARRKAEQAAAQDSAQRLGATEAAKTAAGVRDFVSRMKAAGSPGLAAHDVGQRKRLVASWWRGTDQYRPERKIGGWKVASRYDSYWKRPRDWLIVTPEGQLYDLNGDRHTPTVVDAPYFLTNLAEALVDHGVA